ncbi:hypothetical protein ASE86_00340 [Sphingomonas sp. Leaf33]|uniref:hypothetical protein n=1 Tax=Sphingomonas sp. Leaf33 TaxID=1736215 RepID=UPI0007021A13|nr:hypothetical protein [Sphingomonas sp. Leaf33]KQN26740.1 hypothetical protein ASE86_00340 [Sphingomonas sp. Leaf33]
MDAKKNVTIEVRLPDVTKAAFMARCRAEGRSASDAVRGFIDAQLAPRPAPLPRVLRRGALIWTIGLAFGTGIAAPSLARPERPAAPSFAHLDRNHDGVIDRREYRAR